ncbi:AmmeMemoRadiSam system protein B [Patescibacteria group bacterium]|nr:AmmeMemoRadiSam system protein B [Patescibacteria group bacterium]
MKRFFPLLLGIFIFLGICLSQKGSSSPPAIVEYSSPILFPEPNPSLIEGAFRTKEHWSVDPTARIAIVPHHLIAARPMASLFSTLPKAKYIIILSPDHFSQGETSFTVPSHDLCTGSNKQFNCAGGKIANELIQSIIQQVTSTRRQDEAFAREHGVYTLIPFLRRTQPEAKIIPVLLKQDAPKEELESLSTALLQIMLANPDTLMLSSVDMSHYQTQEVADFHDALTQSIIDHLDLDRVNKAETDSPETLAVTLTAAQRLGLQAQKLSHTNSLILTRAILDRVSTSHLIVRFGTSAIPLSTQRLETEFWHQLPKIATEEDRLYRGFDGERIFDEPTLPYFFGVVRQGITTHVYPFPFDQERQLLTREARITQIIKDELHLKTWLTTNLKTKAFELIY